MGALGEVALGAGLYGYAGSALGPGGVRGRLASHLRARGRRHWHVDRLRAVASPEEAWWTVHPGRLECRWARAGARLAGARRAVEGFGATDCGCDGHLVKLPDDSPVGGLRSALESATPSGATVQRAGPTALRGLAR